MAKKQTAKYQTEIEAQVPAGVTVAFREESSLNPPQIIIMRGSSPLNVAQADQAIRDLLTVLLAEL